MPLNLQPRSSEDFTPYLKFNGKAGRWYTKTDTGEEREVLNLTAIFDLGTIKTGWILFSEGAAPDTVWDNGSGVSPAPSPKHKRGFAVNVYSPQVLGGLREFSSTSNGAIIAIRELYDTYEQTYDPQKTMVPVVTCEIRAGGQVEVRHELSAGAQNHQMGSAPAGNDKRAAGRQHRV